MSSQRHIAFYLPQYHPIPENNRWWGEGFTEWTNVATSQPRFRHHHQPQIPADLGFYDLRLPDTREAQASLARHYGIDAFCYYHYWFGDGRRLLERPFDEVLKTGKPDFPFCLAWANENWTRRWDGHERHVLMQQDYAGHERRHGRWLAEAFRDPRYVRVDGKPLFLVYRATDLPDARAMTRVWRDEAMQAGVGEIYLCRIENFPNERTDPTTLGFDASAEFAPDWFAIPRARRKHLWRLAQELTPRGRRAGTYRAFDYDAVKEGMLAKPQPSFTRFPCVTPGWDNSARRRHDAMLMRGATPESYRDWVRRASLAAPATATGESLVFVNAWNEWGEGAHLEPDQRFGRGFLAAHRDGRADVAALEARPEDEHLHQTGRQ